MDTLEHAIFDKLRSRISSGDVQGFRDYLSSASDIPPDCLRQALVFSFSSKADSMGEILIEYGAGFDTRPDCRHNMLIQAITFNCFKTFKAMLSKNVFDLASKWENGWTLFHVVMLRYAEAVDRTYAVPVIDELLRAGADINAQDNRGCTPLMAVVKSKSIPFLVRELLIRGADPNIKDSCGMTALHLACCTDVDKYVSVHESIIEDLVDFGADINATDISGSTPLHYICADLVLNFLTYDPNLFIEDRNGMSAIEAAVSFIVYGNDTKNAKSVYLYLEKLSLCGLTQITKLQRSFDSLRSLDLNWHEVDVTVNRCKIEIECMNIKEINSELTCLQFLRTPPNRLLRYSNSIMDFFTTVDYTVIFPNYASFINKQLKMFKKVKCRHDLVTQGKDAFSQLEPNLPEIPLNIIMEFLDNNDLSSLNNAFTFSP